MAHGGVARGTVEGAQAVGRPDRRALLAKQRDDEQPLEMVLRATSWAVPWQRVGGSAAASNTIWLEALLSSCTPNDVARRPK